MCFILCICLHVCSALILAEVWGQLSGVVSLLSPWETRGWAQVLRAATECLCLPNHHLTALAFFISNVTEWCQSENWKSRGWLHSHSTEIMCPFIGNCYFVKYIAVGLPSELSLYRGSCIFTNLFIELQREG